ncbi:MAG TPA: PEPxxWA-CTERM sorting domain-containing protein [Caulobacteraceae bacterium]|nr:PEPxxWA-CTERM sorting domain-containing protein [Caulobacteraceae bacterium]
MTPMNLMVGAAMAGTLALPGSAGATYFVVNVNSTPTIKYHADGQIELVSDIVYFSDIFVQQGDTFTINVNFIPPITQFSVAPGRAAAFLCEPRGSPCSNHHGLELSWNENPTFYSDGFSVDGSASGYGHNPKADIDLRLIDYYFASSPEPATWTMMILGMGAIGVALRRRRIPAAV